MSSDIYICSDLCWSLERAAVAVCVCAVAEWWRRINLVVFSVTIYWALLQGVGVKFSFVCLEIFINYGGTTFVLQHYRTAVCDLLFRYTSKKLRNLPLAFLCCYACPTVHPSACLPVYPFAWNNSTPTAQIFVKFYVSVFFETLSRKFKVH